MQKPSDFDEAREYGEQKPLESGGHILIIKKVEETTSSTGKAMIIINFDTADRDKQPKYFKQRYDADTRQEKKWPGRVWQLVYNDDGSTNPSFKTFITSVEKSNSSSFKVKWGDKFCDCFKDKLVGGVFRREQFVNNKGKTAWAVKCMGFRSVAAIDEGVEIPEDKYLNDNEYDKAHDYGGYPAPPDANVQVPPPSDDDYLF